MQTLSDHPLCSLPLPEHKLHSHGRTALRQRVEQENQAPKSVSSIFRVQGERSMTEQVGFET